MIEKWFEPFTLLEAEAASDGLGGENRTFTGGTAFRGALSYTTGAAADAAGQFLLEENPVLLHEFDLTLLPGDYVRRERDGAIYRVTDRSDNLRAPAFSGLRFAQAAVKRVVLPC